MLKGAEWNIIFRNIHHSHIISFPFEMHVLFEFITVHGFKYFINSDNIIIVIGQFVEKPNGVELHMRCFSAIQISPEALHIQQSWISPPAIYQFRFHWKIFAMNEFLTSVCWKAAKWLPRNHFSVQLFTFRIQPLQTWWLVTIEVSE